MPYTEDQRLKITRIVNVFETGVPAGKYDNISVYKDGPVVNGERIYQITYGRSQTTEFGNMPALVDLYIGRNGIYAPDFALFGTRIGKQPSLRSDNNFKRLLRESAQLDPIMRSTQDEFFDLYYFQPAVNWFDGQGFTEALSLLVIYDSFIHSGSIPGFLRQRFQERTPFNGGDENTWISQYTETRHSWLKTHTNPVLRLTIYRTRCFMEQMAAGNWDLSLPVNANGTIIQ
jgi:chitosanase